MPNDFDRRYAIVGMACRLPAARDIHEFERLLFEGRSAISELPADRLDRALYFDSTRGRHGRTYTLLGGWVPEEPIDREVGGVDRFDPAHRLFCETAMRAWNASGLSTQSEIATRSGIYVGHSGGTKLGGQLSLATQIEESLDFLKESEAFQQLDPRTQRRVLQETAAAIQSSRPQRRSTDSCRFHAYSAAAFAAERLGFGGPRSVVDAACASSLLALSHALFALDAGRIDAAIVGGATYNNVDNLILFSHSQACTSEGSRPFDDQGSGLVSSEGYVAVAVTRLADAVKWGLPIRAVVSGLGVSSDGRGKSLWAPRREGQELAIRRAYGTSEPLTIDYLEAHATSTQLGDATELESLTSLRKTGRGHAAGPLLIGSVKSNIGHTLEAAGLVGLVKLALAIGRKEIPESINYRHPTKQFDWSSGQVQVVDHRRPWPDSGNPRRGAVNAFGIGGLNAHVIVEEYVPGAASNAVMQMEPEVRPSVEPIAIVGRGVVLPGAANVAEFLALLKSQRSVLSDPPRDRWRAESSGPIRSTKSQSVYRGGYISGYHFPAETYRIPPKQVRQANPLQLMLLDAVTQAMQECDGGKWLSDRTRTGVVIGTAFGGEFSNQLQVGLRLPEIERELKQSLKGAGVTGNAVEHIAASFHKIYLDNRPALLDETGSFTASTLASRVAKTFDLMGGACAVDADDASGLAAMNLAIDLLRSGRNDAMICGAAQRALDLVAFEHLDVRGRLVSSGRPEDVPEDLSCILPGEGVAVLVLRRMSDAVREGLPIYGIIDELEIGSRPLEYTSGTRVLSENRQDDAALVRAIGYVTGAHGLIRLVSECGGTPNHKQPQQELHWRAVKASSLAEDGFEIKAEVRVPAEPAMSPPIPKQRTQMPSQGNFSALPATSRRVVRLRAENEQRLLLELQAALADPATAFIRATAFDPQDAFRIAVLADSPDALAASLHAVLTRWNGGQRRTILEKEQAILWRCDDVQNRVAWLFPGQGSQYHERPGVIDEHPGSASILSRLDQAATAAGMPALSPAFGAPAHRLGNDLWWTQAWILGVSACLTDGLRSRGHRPDVVLGHSFGEFSASVAAGSLSLEQSLRMAKHRADAVVMCCREQGALLSVRGMPSEVHAVLRQHDLPAVVTHHNSPRHTVIACGLDQVKTLQSALNAAGLASLKIPVPAAFHTPMMADAENVFRHATAEEAIRPPVCGFLSATTAEYAAEPDAVRRSLVTQLTKPVLYEPTVRRLLRDGCGLLIEIGPNDVLTRLNREIIGDTAVCLSLDLPGSSFSERIALAELAMECVTARSSHAAVLRTSPSAPQPRTATSLVESQPTDDVEMFDVRARARRLEETSQAADRSQPVTDVDVAETSLDFAEEASDDVETTSDLAPEAVYEFLTNLLVELTGYSPEVIDLDADLEADLGLDSIKKAQMIGELSEWAGLAIAPSQVRLGSLSNLRQIAALAQGVAIVETAARPKTSRPSQAREPQPAAAPVMQDAAPSLDAAAVEQLLVDFVIDQTGYSREIIDLDADLEADLGVDSIKRAQLLGEMHEQFNLTGLSLERTSLNRFPTLRSIRDFLLQQLADDGGDESVSESPATTPRRDFAPAPPPPRRAKPQRQPAPAAASSSIVLGVEPHDEIPDAWRTLFDLNALADDPAAIRENQQRRGQEHRHEIRAALRLQIATEQETAPATTLDAVSTSALEGLAAGAGVSVAAVRATHQTLFPTRQAPPSPLGEGSESPPRKSPQNSVPSPSETSTYDHASSAAGRTRRFALRMIPAPRREGTPTKFELKGPVLILGENPIATAIKERVQAEGGRAIRFGSSTAPGDVATRLEELWKSGGVTPHLFLTSPHDDDSLREINAAHWQHRRNAGVQTPFRICQLWMERMIAEGRMDEGSVVAVANLGGDFGFSGHGVTSPEGGGIGGLLKAMVIESWMRGFRNTPMKVVDIAPETSPRDAVEGLWRELATPSYDMEVEVCGENRRTVQAVAAPLDEASRSRNAPQGAWILSGGGRGITAITGMALAQRYNLTLHLLGTAAVPEVTPAMRAAAKADRSQLRREIMRAASDVGENAIEAWRDAEKAIEIDATLQECRERGIRATYHCCDVSDAGDVKGTLEAIRRQDGPIRGVIHGAGAGQDARFDRKRPDKVDKCIRAKVDGCLTLMSATEDDPLDWFVTFGSISGRFGANGHTDYSLANDMLAKIVDLYRRERPDVASLTFHWHAWGDVGMATKPEARLALEMIDMEFMPAADGLAHFLREFEFGGDEPEVLITDHKYYRKFFPAERITDTTAAETVNPFPLLSSPNAEQGSGQAHLDPVRDLFLAQHLVNGRPTLPFVVALELMAEGARSAAGDHPVRSCRNLEALQALKFATDEPLDASIAMQSSPPRIGEDYPRLVRCALRADLRQRNGRLVEAGREYFRGEFLIGEPEGFGRTSWPDLTDLEWRPIEYQGPEAPVYHGPELRSLRRFAIAGETSFGRIGASASVQLFGGNRPARGWTVSCDTMDACLYACALHAWNRQRKPSLPVRFDEITFGRLPDPGEPCLVRIEEHGANESGMDFSFRLWGQNGDVLLDVQGYRVAWLHL